MVGRVGTFQAHAEQLHPTEAGIRDRIHQVIESWHFVGALRAHRAPGRTLRQKARAISGTLSLQRARAAGARQLAASGGLRAAGPAARFELSVAVDEASRYK